MVDGYGIKKYLIKLLLALEVVHQKIANPWLVLRFNTVDGEDYGRGRVEEFLGDLKSLEGLSQALTEGSSAAAKVVFFSLTILNYKTKNPSSGWERSNSSGSSGRRTSSSGR